MTQKQVIPKETMYVINLVGTTLSLVCVSAGISLMAYKTFVWVVVVVVVVVVVPLDVRVVVVERGIKT